MALPHRTRVLELLAQSSRALHVSEIAGRLGGEVDGGVGLTAMLDDMVLTGAVRAFPGRRYKITEGVSVVETPTGRRTARERPGVLTMNPRGFGFVTSPGTGEPDAFIAPDALGGALHGDKVIVRVFRTTARGPEGEIAEILQRGVKRVPGTLRRRGKSAWIEPDDSRVRGPITVGGDLGNEGDAVVATITRYPVSSNENLEGEIAVVLGRPGDPRVEVEKILAREEVTPTFPDDVVAEARAYGDAITEAQIEGREDLRPLLLVTIDPKDARDHDDAVFVRRAGEHDGEAAYIAWIAIADVSAYVRPDTALDREALRRSCSVYLPDRAIPMLPRELSSNLCSLISQQDRLCLAVEVALDATGSPVRHRLVEGVMRSRAKLTYEDVARALGFSRDAPPSEEAMAHLPHLKVAWEASGLLRARRMRRGALDFDLPEAKVVLDANGECIDVVRARGDAGVKKAYNLIEEMMLLANEIIAEELTGKTVPTVYRVHGVPDEKRLDQFANLAETLGIGFELEDAKDPKALGKFLKVIATHPQAAVLNSLLLRAMKQATYDVVNIGHFGLASKAYLHFTSPIRRYPDLVVHRAVHKLCRGEPVARDEHTLEALRESALAASVAERKAMEVEREVVDLHRAVLMQKHIGEVLEGTVSAVVGSGVFVAIDEPYVDVLVRYEAIGDEPYELDDDGISAIGRSSGDTIRMGDRMVVRVQEVSIQRRTVYGSRAAASTSSASARSGKTTRGRSGAHEKPGQPRPRAAAGGGAKAKTASGGHRETTKGGRGGRPKSKPTRKGKSRR